MSLERNESTENIGSRNFRVCDLKPDALDERSAFQLRQGIEVRDLFVIDEFIFLLGVVQLAVDHVIAKCQAVGQQNFADLKV